MTLSIVIAILSLTPGHSDASATGFVWLVQATPSLLQNSMHVVLYGCLAGSWLWALQSLPAPRTRRARLVLAFAIAFGLGILLEWLQTSVPGRFGSLYDVVLNGIGAAIGLVAASKLLKAGD
ncbi:MAG: VanZ family protein [Pseudomonadales bacterium]